MTYETRTVTRDGEPVFQLKCPGCGTWGDLDDDQINGRISIQCVQDGCSFHETVDLNKVK